jgi:DNA polymerase-3 subunit epsilon
MRKLEHEIFVCIDCETTGLDLVSDEIIEVAVNKFTLKESLEEYESLIDPQKSIPAESIKIHNISEEMVKGKPFIKDVLPELLEFIGSHVVVGHGIKFDIEMIAKSADRAGFKHRLRENRFIDTLRLARLYGGSPVNSLEELRKHFNIQPEGAHRAMSDVVVNVDVFRQLCREYHSLHELFEALSRPIQMKIMPLGKHKGREIKEIPLDYLQWAANKDFDQDLLFSLRSEIKRRKKGNSFAQAANPFQGL